MEVRDEQDMKHRSPNLVTEEGMSIDVRAQQPEKHKSSNIVTL